MFCLIALERAIMQYHSEKMSNINRSLRDLWRSTYRGNDIDHIEIVTDEPAGGDASANAALRRSKLNYRVVGKFQAYSYSIDSLQLRNIVLRAGDGEARPADGYARPLQCGPESARIAAHPPGARRSVLRAVRSTRAR